MAASKHQEEAHQQIRDKLGVEMDEFLKTKWNEMSLNEQILTPIPVWFTERFPEVLLHIPAVTFKRLAAGLITLTERKSQDLQFGEVGIIIEGFNLVEPKVYCDDIEDWKAKRSILDAITFCQTEKMGIMQKSLADKEKIMVSFVKPNGKIITGSNYHP